MKQQITLENWNELSDEEKKKFWIAHSPKFNKGLTTRELKYFNFPTIGQLIEFLGDDMVGMYWCDKNKDGTEQWWWVVTSDSNGEEYFADELIDALWEATKHKL